MQLVPILLVASVMAVDGGLRPLGADWGLDHSLVAALACGPVALVLLLLMPAMLWCERRLMRGRHRALISADRIGRAARMLIIANHFAAVLVFGWLETVRSMVGNPILLDELIAIAPALLGLIGVWAAYYPIERRLEQASLIRQLDDGRPVYPSLSRGQFVLMQTRMHLLLTLVPVLMIVAISEVLGIIGTRWGITNDAEWILAVGKIGAAAGVFMFAPLMARVILDVQPMPACELRDRLIEVCRRHNVKIRELLIWRTNGSMFNAAVMGLIGRLRYVLITDALLDTMRQEQVRAVMAHEIGHVRRHHMVWMLVCLIACFVLAWHVMQIPLWGIHSAGLIRDHATANGVGLAFSGAELVLALVSFGWICRRFERQADTFAVQHLSMIDSHSTIEDSDGVPRQTDAVAGPEPESSIGNRQSSSTITPSAVHAMCRALDNIAHLNMIDPHRPSWRHGSIAWRMIYLSSLMGLPADRLPIDRLVKRIKFFAMFVLIASAGLAVLMQWQLGGIAS
jgi:STE24 endopeptidase